MKTTIRSTIGKFDEDEEKIATEELLNIFDNFYTEFNDVLSRALNEEDVKDMIKQVLEIIRKEKQNGPLTQTVVPRILLMIAEIVLNNKTLNQVAQEEFEKLTGVTVDAE
ncbi:hypothetical protein TRFO_37388 [Tritrichomonas foetus]|uniref:Uncharacterized protein n=1 Tax=Tritrichomonas foetus TaxID=1144522 RepID=A0A1J4JCP4_9EUKA|nr:hypothetical protein TRFO_37388 [Tritrichomonas foetus]|eukprot:OHS96441.1 hypothetical protein TRFO_37388 [Tritrichomonas foetus]